MAEANKADEYWIDEAPKQSRMFGFQLQEEPVPLGKYLHDGDIILSLIHICLQKDWQTPNQLPATAVS